LIGFAGYVCAQTAVAQHAIASIAARVRLPCMSRSLADLRAKVIRSDSAGGESRDRARLSGDGLNGRPEKVYDPS